MSQTLEPAKPKNLGGRPTKKTPEILSKLAQYVALGLTNEEACSIVGITRETLNQWQSDPSFSDAMQSAKSARLAKRLAHVESGTLGWQGTAWILERCYGTRFSRPEVQLNVQNNVNNTTNLLTVVQENIDPITSVIRFSNQERGIGEPPPAAQ